MKIDRNSPMDANTETIGYVLDEYSDYVRKQCAALIGAYPDHKLTIDAIRRNLMKFVDRIYEASKRERMLSLSIGRQIEHQEREMKKSNIRPLSAEEFSRVVSYFSKLFGFEYNEGEESDGEEE